MVCVFNCNRLSTLGVWSPPLYHWGHRQPDLAKLIDAWPTLPEPLKAGIRAMVEAAIVTQE